MDGQNRTVTEKWEPAGPRKQIARRNFWAWVLHQALYRVGWQFKMEATMIAGLVSYLSSSPAIIGIFSTASSIGRCAGPFLVTPWVDRSPLKKRCVLWLWAGVVVSWGAGAVYFWLPQAEDRAAALWWFFITYSLFFTFLGCAGVAQGALLGKIIPAGRRGSALSAAHTISGPVNLLAILGVYSLLRSGAFPTPRNYAFSFTVTTFLFVLSGLAIVRAHEKPSDCRDGSAGLRARLRYARKMVDTNRDYRILLLIQILLGFGGGALSFYTAYGKQVGSIHDSNVLLATFLQVLFQSSAAAFLGRVADRRGNRAVIRSLLWVEAMTPVSTVLTATLFPGTPAYLLVYCMVGLRFPVFDVITNYLLEIVPQEDHALALGTANTILLVTVGSPLILGMIAGYAGYPVIMLTAAAILCAAAIAAFYLGEPRARASATTRL